MIANVETNPLDAEPQKLLPDESDRPFTGLTREWFHTPKIMVYKLTAVSETVINNWAELVLETIRTWDKTTPYLAIHDLSQAGVSLQYAALVNFDMMNIGVTMHGRILAEELFDQNKGFSAKIAMNFNLSLSGQTNRTLMNFLSRENPAIRYKTFYSRTKCVKWLTGELTDTAELKSVQSPLE